MVFDFFFFFSWDSYSLHKTTFNFYNFGIFHINILRHKVCQIIYHT